MLTVKVENPGSLNVVMGQGPLVGNLNKIRDALKDVGFGFACKQASSEPERATHCTGTDSSLISLARRNVDRVDVSQTFFLVTNTAEAKDVLRRLKKVPAIQAIYCATSSSNVEIIVRDGSGGRGVMGLTGNYSDAQC